MKCKEAKILLVPYITGGLEPNSSESLALEEHLQTCKACAEEYAEFRATIEFINDYKAEFTEAFKNVEKKEAAQRAERLRIIRLFTRASAVAACLLIGISLFWIIFTNHSKPQITPKNPSSEQFVSAPAPTVKIEEVSGNGKVLIANGQQVISYNQLKTLIINDKHRLIMDENTTLSIKPLTSNEHIGCVVSLASGQIYAHVEHDGNPFVVEYAHGKAVITGTTFDIKAMDTGTTLIVAEGTVQFASQAGSVKVSAGYKSEIIAKSAPTKPSLCDTAKLTAWATGYEIKTTIAKIEAISDSFDVSDLWFTANSGPLDLEKIDFGQWIEQKRDWFTKEFPLIFQLKEALVQEDIETDYPELLFTSGYLWQFKYPNVSNNQFTVLTYDSLLRVASEYDFDRNWLIKNIPSIKSLDNNPSEGKGVFTGREAFQTLIEKFEQARKSQNSVDSNLLIYSLHASTYLTNTRTLIWLYIANEQTTFESENKADLLALLQNEVNEAEKLKEYIIRLFTISENCPCEEFNVLIDKVIDSLAEISEVEERVSGYEISK